MDESSKKSGEDHLPQDNKNHHHQEDYDNGERFRTTVVGSNPSSLKDASKNTTTTSTSSSGAVAAVVVPPPPNRLLLSASESLLESKHKSVTTLRKDELLLQARSSRLQWIRQVPFPYLKPESIREFNNNNNNKKKLDPLAPLRETHAGRLLPTALHVLEHLYGLDDETINNVYDDEDNNNNMAIAPWKERIANLSRSLDKIVPTPEQDRKFVLQKESLLQRDDNKDDDDDDDEDHQLLLAYHLCLQNFNHPAAALLVQNMKNFCRNFATLQPKSNQKADQDHFLAVLTSYVASTVEAAQTHVLWKTTTTNNPPGLPMSLQQRSLESFLYGQCRAHIDSILWTEDMRNKEREWQERLQALQFVTPVHLEIACLQEYTPEQLQQIILKKPIQQLQTVSLYHSPMEKLNRILKTYRAINAALKLALNQKKTTTSSSSSNKSVKLPSADDVLPTFIWTVLAARPIQLLYHLQLIEDFCPTLAFRGEAGYAFTNLFGAIQFLNDIPLHGQEAAAGPFNNLSHQATLTISPQEFQWGLQRCRQEAAQKIQSSAHKLNTLPMTTTTAPVPTKLITPRDIHLARQNGITLDIQWARNMTLVEEKPKFDEFETGGDASKETGTTLLEEEESTKTGASKNNPPESLAPFRRSYTFLSYAPQDIKVTDLPILLEEYRNMVHATEELLMERQNRWTLEKKQQNTKDEHALLERVQRVDPLLWALESSPQKK